MFPATVQSHFSRKKTEVYLHHTEDQQLKRTPDTLKILEK